MNILLQLLLILFLAKIFGEIVERSGFPSILGEILAGLFLGTFFASFMLHPDSEIIPFFAELGAIFLLFTAGYKEVHISELKAASKIALIPTLGGIAIPFAFGYFLGNAFGFGFLESLFMGVAFSPTSIGVVVKTLIDFDYLSSKPGSVMLTSAIFDDIIGLFLLAVVVTIATYDKLPSGMQLLIIAAKIIIFLMVMAILGSKVFPKIFTYIHRMHVKESIFAFVVMIALFSAYLAEIFGLHAVIGAFIGGVLISDIPFAKLEDVQSKVSGFAYGIFVPFFFAFIGLSVDISVIKTAGLFAILVVVLALSGKLIGGFIGTKLIGFDSRDSLIFGVGVMPRAGVELVIISIGREMGIIGGEVFSAIVLMVAVSVVVSPMMLKFAIESKERSKT
ncbi:MAG: cation:proton antiporter, partial [Methanosarcinales archaeon]|nr:cation:proton antiporter [Methanosarcinales archaeon]